MLTEHNGDSMRWGCIVTPSDIDPRWEWCTENLGPRMVPGIGFIWREPWNLSDFKVYNGWRDMGDIAQEEWRFRYREHAVMFDIVWA